MEKLSLKVKLIISYFFVGLVPLLTVSIYSYKTSSVSLEKESVDRLVAVEKVKALGVTRYFEGIRDQMLTFSTNIMIVDAMMDFSKSFRTFTKENGITDEQVSSMYSSSLKEFYQNQFGKKYLDENKTDVDSLGLLNQLPTNEKAMQYFYISNNKHPLGSKENLDHPEDNSLYSNYHKKYHPVVRNFLRKFGYYDIFLIDIDTGNIVYSVYKELDYATSLLTGPYSKTNFADAFRKAKTINKKDQYVLVDYKKYTPSYEAPASFIAAPIWKGENKIGVAIFQMPIDRLNEIMGERSGMGKTGETYMVGADKLMRSDSYLDSENYSVLASFKRPESGTLNSVSVEKALAGEEGYLLGESYLGDYVISSYAPIDILGLRWGLISEISASEALKPVEKLRNTITLIVLCSSLAILIIAMFMSKYLVKDLSSRISKVADRLFHCSKAVGDSSESILVSSTHLSEAATEQAASIQETVSSIEEISSMIQKNADAAENSSVASTKSNELAVQGKETVESMIESIGEISSGNEEIAKEMEKSNENISKIVGVISEIGEKTKVINDIVFQTKLLSFNASVEAARAGDHGKGFAVVAEEVGNLASMSGKAALEITDMLESSIKEVTEIVEMTRERVDKLVHKSKDKVDSGTNTAHKCGEALDEILQNVSAVNSMVLEITTASTEQSAGVQEVNKVMQQLDETTHRNTSVAQDSSTMAKNLRSHAEELDQVILELKAIVSGNGGSEVKHEVGPLPENKADNVVSLPDKKPAIEPKSQAAAPTKKASGFESNVPDESDPRFEDF